MTDANENLTDANENPVDTNENLETHGGEQAERSPEEIRAQIDQTREQLGDTVEALAEKTDVKTQAKNRLSGFTQAAQAKRDEFVSKAKEATPESASAGAQQVSSTVQQQPLPFAAAASFVAGLLIGWLLGRSN